MTYEIISGYRRDEIDYWGHDRPIEGELGKECMSVELARKYFAGVNVSISDLKKSIGPHFLGSAVPRLKLAAYVTEKLGIDLEKQIDKDLALSSEQLETLRKATKTLDDKISVEPTPSLQAFVVGKSIAQYKDSFPEDLHVTYRDAAEYLGLIEHVLITDSDGSSPMHHFCSELIRDGELGPLKSIVEEE